EEIARLGAEVFDRRVRPILRPEDNGKFVAIDVATGDYELDQDDYAAVTRLRNRQPSAEVWLGQVGQPAAYRMRRLGCSGGSGAPAERRSCRSGCAGQAGPKWTWRRSLTRGSPPR